LLQLTHYVSLAVIALQPAQARQPDNPAKGHTQVVLELSTTEDAGDAEEKSRFETGLNLLSSVSPVVAT